MDMDSYVAGAPCWTDCSCSDVDKAADFYRGLLGWDVPEGDPNFGGYRSASLNGKSVAGLMGQMEPGPVVWTTYLKTDDSAATAALVVEHGGSVMFPPFDVGPLGKMAILVDPTGAVFGTWEPAIHTGSQVMNDPGARCWSELITTDVAAATEFYGKVFGWEFGGSPDYTEFKVAGQPVGGIMAKTAMMPAEMPSNWGVYFTVTDIAASVAKAAELGATVILASMEVPQTGTMAVLMDPNGAPFNIIQMNPGVMA
jgi:uncharacterized protein